MYELAGVPVVLEPVVVRWNGIPKGGSHRERRLNGYR